MADETEIEGLEISLVEKNPSPYKLLFAGGVAGSVAKTVTSPLSRVVILFQVNSLVKTGYSNRLEFASGIMPAFQKILQREGFLALWKGNLTSIVHRFPYSGINFVLFEHFKPHVAKVTKDKQNGESSLTRFLSGALAGVIASTFCYPLDLVRTRLTTQRHEIYYKGIVHAFQRISKEEGAMGLYRGLGTSLFVSVPNLAFSLMTYHALKDRMAKQGNFLNYFRIININKETSEITVETSMMGTLICGALSGIVSSVVTFPIDVIRRRMQMEGLLEHKGTVKPHGPLKELAWIVEKEGIRGLYRGLSAELLKVVPMVGTTFVVYEGMKTFLHE